MHYLKRNTRFSILAFLIIVLSITISIFILAKTEVYFSLYDKLQKEIIKNINQSQTFINIAKYVFPHHAWKIISLRDSLCGGFKGPKDFLQLSELTNLDWQEWEEGEIKIIVE
jgi:hypothetical protein